MSHNSHNLFRAHAFMSLAPAAALGVTGQTQAKGVQTLYNKAAPREQYMMDRGAEITLARSAAPESISRNAEVLVSYDGKQLPMPDPGAMCYMMSKQQYFGASVKNADPHLMFWFAESDKMAWGAGLRGSPVYVHQDSPDPITTFVISVSEWSDGTPAPAG